jgi:hypothetical protein
MDNLGDDDLWLHVHWVHDISPPHGCGTRDLIETGAHYSDRLRQVFSFVVWSLR